jgi:hypothetical protein
MLDIKKGVREMIAKQERGEKIDTPKDDFFTIEEKKEETNLAEDMTEKDEDDAVDPFDDDPKPSVSKTKPDQSEADKVKFAHKDETPKAEKTEMPEKKTDSKEKVTEPISGETKKVDTETLAPAEGFTKKFKVKTVYGDEELTVEELAKGYMRTQHYTQERQKDAPRQKAIQHLLANPEELVRYAVENGVDLKKFVQPDTVIGEFNLPEPGSMAPDEIRAQWEFSKRMFEQNKGLMNEINKLKQNTQTIARINEQGTIEKEFKENRGNLPDKAMDIIDIIYRYGRRIMPDKGYSVQDAINDFRIAQGDLFERLQGEPKFEEWKRKIEEEAIARFSSEKQLHEKQNLSPDNVGVPKAVPGNGKEKVTAANWRQKMKEAVKNL